MKDLFDLTGRVSVITGSTKGIGKAMAEALAAFGSKVVISSRKADACDAVAASINESGGEAMAHPCHVGHKDQLERLVAATRERWGKIDNLEPVDCAGIAVYLASRAGSWTTGQTFTVDGGVLGCG